MEWQKRWGRACLGRKNWSKNFIASNFKQVFDYSHIFMLKEG
jgi:hypothetical protein